MQIRAGIWHCVGSDAFGGRLRRCESARLYRRLVLQQEVQEGRIIERRLLQAVMSTQVLVEIDVCHVARRHIEHG